MAKTLKDIAEAMRDIDFCTLATHTGGGAIGSRPMSNNRNVDFEGDTWFFTYEDRLMVRDIEADANVGVTYLGSAGPQGHSRRARPVHPSRGPGQDRPRPQPHSPSTGTSRSTAGFRKGRIRRASCCSRSARHRIHYWDGEEEGEVHLPVGAAA